MDLFVHSSGPFGGPFSDWGGGGGSSEPREPPPPPPPPPPWLQPWCHCYARSLFVGIEYYYVDGLPPAAKKTNRTSKCQEDLKKPNMKHNDLLSLRAGGEGGGSCKNDQTPAKSKSLPYVGSL